MPAEPSEDEYRREGLGAYAHDVRTPLTALRMVLDLARQDGVGGGAVLDAELVRMAHETLDDIERLTARLQDLSRMERGRFRVEHATSAFPAVWEATLQRLRSRLTAESGTAPAVRGRWDRVRLAVALADLVTATDRAGDGTSRVRVNFDVAAERVHIALASGVASGEERPLAADFGFAFFHARSIVAAMGGDVAWQRTTDGFSATITLPLLA